MQNFFTYMIQFSISLFVLYVVYWAFFRKDTFFMVNRFYLLGAIVFSLAIPLFDIPVFYQEANTAFIVLLETVTVGPEMLEESMMSNLSFYQSLFVIYITGVCIFLFRFLFQIFQLTILINKYGVKRKNGLKFVCLNKDYTPFSYFNIVFLNKHQINDENIDRIIEHEKVHINQYHSIDVIILELLTILQWFNPVVWMYKFSLKELHEYLADEGAIADGYNKSDYQHLLLNQTVGMQLNDLTNNFNQSLIKRRIIMLSKLKSNRRHRLKFLFVLPVVVCLVIGLSVSATKIVNAKNVKAQAEQKQNEKKADKKTVKGEDVYRIVEERPDFPGGNKAMSKFLAENTKYPEKAKKKGIQGTVFVTFVVEKDGSISNVKVLRGIAGGCNEEATRVVKLMPKWIPGVQKGEKVRVQFNLPIRFNLN